MDTKTYTHCNPLELLETVGFDQEIFTDWVSLFLKESLLQFDKVCEAIAANDCKMLEFESHALKGTVGHTGAHKLVEMLLKLEEEAHQGICDCPPPRLAEVRDELMATRAEMENFLNQGEFPTE